MRKLGLFIVIALLSMTVVAQDTAPEWQHEALGEGIKPAIDVDAEGAVHIAYIVEAEMGGLYYVSNSSGAWETALVAEGYFYGPEDIAVSADGIPYIAYHDHQSEQFNPGLGDEVVAWLTAEGEWELLTVAHEGHDGWDNDIDVDAEGFWHTASVDPAQFQSQDGIEYATNAYGEVIVEQIGSGPVNYEFATSIETRVDGMVGISYFDSVNEDLIYAERSARADGTWTLTTVDSEGDVGKYSSLAYDADGNPHITYFANGDEFAGSVRYTWRDAEGDWHFEEVDTLENVRAGRVGARKLTGLQIDSNGNIHVMYSDRLLMTYAQRDADGNWSYQQVAESETDSGNLGSLVEFVLDSNDQPHVTYFAVTNFNPFNGTIMYATTVNDE